VRINTYLICVVCIAMVTACWELQWFGWVIAFAMIFSLRLVEEMVLSLRKSATGIQASMEEMVISLGQSATSVRASISAAEMNLGLQISEVAVAAGRVASALGKKRDSDGSSMGWS
jgi:hypothetical protein